MTQVSFKFVISTLTTIILTGLELIWQQFPHNPLYPPWPQVSYSL